jgi:predicted porin|nr:porin [uncultured Albidiferax sp.]
MKKSLIALAVLASTGAMAQSSVTLYGLVDVGLQSSKVDGGVRKNEVSSGNVNGSRFGLKGSEDLGGGLKALFVLENGFNVDNGSSRTPGSMFDRQAYVGLAGGFGEVRIGNVKTAFDDTAINSNSLFDSNYAPAYAAWAFNYAGAPGNSLYYTSPSFGGVTATVSYALGENKTATTSAKGVAAVNVQYSGGPIYASLAYQEDKRAAPGVGSVADAANKDTLANVSYDLGVVKLLGSYSRHVATDETKSNQFQVGVDVPVGSALTVTGGYAYSKDKQFGVTGEKRQSFGLGAKYALSKRTFVYTAATYAEYKAPVTNDKTKGDIYAIGIQHSF